jgi:hypothetical protein
MEIKPKEAAWDKSLYTVESDTGEHDGIIEAFFSVAESFAADSLRRLLNAKGFYGGRPRKPTRENLLSTVLTLRGPAPRRR